MDYCQEQDPSQKSQQLAEFSLHCFLQFSNPSIDANLEVVQRNLLLIKV